MEGLMGLMRAQECKSWCEQRSLVVVRRGIVAFKGKSYYLKFGLEEEKPSRIVAFVNTLLNSDFDKNIGLTTESSLFWITDWGIWSEASEALRSEEHTSELQ